MSSLGPVVRPEKSRSGSDNHFGYSPVSRIEGRSLIHGASRYAAWEREEARFMARYRGHMLVSGETGSGKDVLLDEVARLARRPMIRLPAGNVPASTAPSDLFGHDKGAFTSADSAATGFVVRANEGWLVFNDADHLVPEIQELVLTVTERREFYVVGHSKRPIRPDVRVILVTHASLDELIRDGRIREDLGYRLRRGHRIRLAPLRDHLDDVPALARVLLERASAEFGVETPALDDGALRSLMSYDYPGNVRELDNRVCTGLLCLLRAGGGDRVSAEHLEAEAAAGRPALRRSREKVSVQTIQAAIATRRTLAEAACEVGLSERSLQRRMKELGIRSPRGPGRPSEYTARERTGL